MFVRKVTFIGFLLFSAMLPFFSWAAPRVPEILTQNGLIYCTHSSGFSFNPQTADAGTSMNVITEQIYNKLFEIKNNSSRLEPSLAQSYKISEDGKTITVYLRKGVEFHHTPWFTPSRNFNADDVVYSLNRVLGHNTSLPEFNASEQQKGMKRQYNIFHELAKKTRFPYFDSIKLNQKIESVTALDPYTVQINLFAPDASILSHLASQYAIIFSHEYALQLNADDNLAQLDLLPVGTGPYQVKNYFRNQYVRLIRHENYWKKEAEIKNIIIDLSPDRTGRLAKFFNNECQIAAFPDVSQLGLLQENGERFQTTLSDGMNLAFLAFNFKRPLMQDVEIRRGIAQAINRHRIIKDIYYNTASVANKIIPSVSWAGSDSNNHSFAYDYDPAQAKKVLQDRQLSLDMWVLKEEQLYNPSPIKMAELIKHDLTKAGIEVKVRLISRNFLMEQLRNNSENYDLILGGWLAVSLDPDSFMRPILSCGTTSEITNLSNWCSQSFEEILDRALISNSTNERAVNYHLAEQEVLSELPILPIASVKRILISNSNVQGVEMSPFGSISFEKLSFKKGEK
ncbi:ABC transporter substrate-binding protein [Basfia succiniciproducens]|uniref:Cationic peptide transport system substrate-binding protein n=1 Tax=Basfia succiniciproducens TaxID=653940 RepID=A0A1G5AA80_9PAST|nr:ABC transporter substrate-binding protein [Basfia succiniciproducens]QIM68266.1 peptide ABC transporter substrate-binding protein [Basfia succiniciproducens]SCX74784.1 cationic peptide transport system substrate-binding protein [Basfia succiniciproducens]